MKIIRLGLYVVGIGLIAATMLFSLSTTVQDALLKRMVGAAFARTPEEPFDGLRVFMCGTSSPLPAPGRAQACVAVTAGEHLYVVDAGARSPQTFNLAGMPLTNLRGIFLTHFHSDHIAAIGDFNLLSWVAGRPEPLEIIGPVGVDEVAAGFNQAYAQDSSYRTAHHGEALLPPHLSQLRPRAVEPGVVLERDGLVVTAFAVNHEPVSPAFGYRFDYRGRSLVISGDTVADNSLRQAAEGADLLLHDAISLPIVQALEVGAQAAGLDRQATIFADIQTYHAPVKDVYELAEQANVGKLALYHFVPPPRNALFRQIFRRNAPSGVVFTEDAMRLDLPTGSKEIKVH